MGNVEKLWIKLRSSLWFVPAFLVAGAILLALGVVELDTQIKPSLAERWPRFFGVSPEGARSILLAISSSTITVAGVVFSVTIVALSVASNQYTPRILRTFMRDRGTQLVLGVFVGAFTYSLIVMRTVRSGQDAFVPALAVAMSIVIALVSVGFFVYFIHHIAAAMHAPTVIAAISSETVSAIEKLFPESDANNAPEANYSANEQQWQCIPSRQTGYVQNIPAGLLTQAEKLDVVVRVERRIGEFVIADTPLLSVLGARRIDDNVATRLLDCIAIDNFRTVDQDPSYGIRQLVDIAQKALSPGINDTSTAINCIDYLAAILYLLVQRGPSPNRVTSNGRARVVYARPLTAQRLINQALLQIRQSAAGNPAIILRMLKIAGELRTVSKPAYLPVIDTHVALLEEVASWSIRSEHDRRVILDRIEALNQR